METRPSRKRKPARLPGWLTEADRRALLAKPSRRYPTGVRNRAIMATMLLAGLRCAETLDLKPRDVTWINDAARRVFGDLIGRPFTTVVAPEFVARVQRALESKLRGAPVTDYEVDVYTSDGRRRRAEISSVRISGGDDCHAIFGVALTGEPRDAPFRPVNMTPRQMEVLRLLAEGSSTDQIAAALHLSRETVRNHVRNLLRALGAHSRLEAVAIAQRQGLLG